jgi:lipopolysaccharide export system protein LptA
MRTPLVLIPLALLLAVPASGQALRGHNSNAPVDVAADRIEVQDRADRAIFSGNVQVKQAGLSLSAPRLTVAYSSAGGGTEIERLDATGGVFVRSATETARGNIAIYDLPRRIITMVGGVELTKGGSNVRGGRLVIDLNSGRSVVDGSAVGGAPGVGGSSSGGRVTGRFTVKQGKPQ